MGNDQEQNVINHSLQKIAKGSVFVFIGTILSIIFVFLARVLVDRNFSSYEYGLFSIGITILSIAAAISTMGLGDGSARNIAFYKGLKDNNKSRITIFFNWFLNIYKSKRLKIV